MTAPGAVAFLLKGYPRLSETFIAQEIHALEQLGLDIHIYSLRPPREAARHPINERITAPVTYLPERLRDDRQRVARALMRAIRRPGFARAIGRFLADMTHDASLDRLRRFGQALVLADELAPGTDRLHAHFLHTPASVARYASALTGLPWSCSAHAKDIWTIGKTEKRTKLDDMAWLVTCTAFGHAHLQEVSPAAEKVHLAYHGLDLDHFPAPPVRRAARDGSDPRDPVRLLSVGRAVEKKGFDLLIGALAELPKQLHWQWTHIGDGDALPALKVQAAQTGIDDKIDWQGSRTQQHVIEAYRTSDLFVLPCRVTADGDRDGMPNVLMEAMSQGLPCLSTSISAIPELITDGETGALIAPDDGAALGAALMRLAEDPQERARLGAAGAQRVRRDFSHQRGLETLSALFRLASAGSASRPAA